MRRRRGRRPAGFCQEQTPVMIKQFSSMERDAFHVPYLSDKTPEAVFHGQAVKTVAYLRVSSDAAGRSQDCHRQAHRRVPYNPLQLHEDPRAQAEPLSCISVRIWSIPYFPPIAVISRSFPGFFTTLDPVGSSRFHDTLQVIRTSSKRQVGQRRGLEFVSERTSLQSDTFLLGHLRSVVFFSCWRYFGFHRALSVAAGSYDAPYEGDDRH